MTSQQPKTPNFADRDIPDTEVIVVPSPAPVFVDSTGRRRRVLRRLAYAFGGLCMVYGGLVSVSLAGGPVSSSAVLPLPDLRGDDDAADAKPTPIPAPSTSAPPQSRFITEALRRPVSAVRQERTGGRPAATTPSRTPTPRPATKSPTPKPTPRPVESTTTDPVEEPPKSEPPSTGPSTPAPEPPVDEPPVPPALPQPGGTGGGSGSGGSGGGTNSGGSGSGGSGSGSGGGSGSGSSSGGDGSSGGTNSGPVEAPGPVPAAEGDAAGSGT